MTGERRKEKDEGVSVHSQTVNCQQDVCINADRELSQLHYPGMVVGSTSGLTDM